MELLNQADKVVRDYLPHVLEAAGEGLSARSLRHLSPLADRDSVRTACGILQEIRVLGVSAEEWEAVVEECAFWCEAAILAALRNDASAFRHHVEKANVAMQAGLPIVSVH